MSRCGPLTDDPPRLTTKHVVDFAAPLPAGVPPVVFQVGHGFAGGTGIADRVRPEPVDLGEADHVVAPSFGEPSQQALCALDLWPRRSAVLETQPLAGVMLSQLD